MNRILSGLGAAAMLALPVAANAYPAMAVVDLNLRACPSMECLALTVIPRGMAVEVLGSSGGWNYVQYRASIGYAAANYLYAGYPAVLPPLAAYPYPLPHGYATDPLPPVAAYPYPLPYGYATAPTPSWDPLHDAWYDAPAFAMTLGLGLGLGYGIGW